MRIFILGLDGLEYNYAAKWKLRGLLQRTCGRYYVGKEYWIWIKGRGAPFSPKVWGSFITGVPPEVHGIKDFFTYKHSFINLIRKVPLLTNFRTKYSHKILKKFGVKRHYYEKKDLSTPTIFDIVTPSIAVDVPGYNMELEEVEKRWRSKTLEEIMDRTIEHFLKKLDRVKILLDSPWKLFMFYVRVLDNAGHTCTVSRLKTYYQSMDNLVYELKELLPKKVGFLIASDHGMTQLTREKLGRKINVHSKHGFFSLNFKTSWKPKSVLDFKPAIVNWGRGMNEIACATKVGFNGS